MWRLRTVQMTRPLDSGATRAAPRAPGWQPVQGLTFAIGAYDGDLGKDTGTAPALHSARRYDALVAWNRNALRLGAERFRADNWKDVSALLADLADGWPHWSSYDVVRASVFARYDRVKPSQRLDPKLRDTYWNAGIAFALIEGIRVAIAYKDERLGFRADADVHTREIRGRSELKF